MSVCDWIICERTSRWASVMRLTLERHAPADGRTEHIYEVRNRHDLAARLAARPDALVAIEVDRANFAEVLTWLAAASRQFPRTRFMAMLDRSLCEDWETGAGGGRNESRDVEHALVEAGALLVVRSPRQCVELVELAHRHAAACAADLAAARDDRSPTEQVWALLPWQAP
jgi:hypothetical protein